MSRVQEGDYDWDEWANLHAGRWERNLRATLKGKKGQAALRELEAALLAMPDKRLVRGTFYEVDEYGNEECCVLGALASYRGEEVAAWLNDADDASAEDTAHWASKKLGMTFTMAYQLVWMNDEDYMLKTPEERWERMLRWVRERISE